MMSSTHAAIGVVVYAGACAFTGDPVQPAALGAAAVGAWLPDVDTPSSRAGFCVYPLAAYLEKKFGHRTITHSFAGTAIFAALCLPLLLWPHLQPLYFALLVGYLSHLLADAATKSGVPLFWPNRRSCVFPGNEAYRVRTGSAAELGVLLAFLLIGMLTVPVQRFGVRRLLHMATNSLGGAVRDAEDWSDSRMTARIEGYDVLNQKVVEGTFPVVGRRDDGALIIERDDGQSGYWLLKEGGTELHRIAPRAVRIDRTGPGYSQTRVVQVTNVTLGALSRALSRGENPKSLEDLEIDTAPTGSTSAGARPGLAGSRFLHRVLVSGEGECWPLPQDPQHAPLDVPQFGMKVVHFDARHIAFDFAQPRHISLAGMRAAIRSATLSVKMPTGSKFPNLNFPTVRREIIARAMLRHTDLKVRVGDLVSRGAALNRTFGQTFEHEITPEEEDNEHQADAARRELRALEVEESALRRGAASTWAGLAPSYRTRRRALERAAAWRAPAALPQRAPAASAAPFDAVVESIEWEPPTSPTRKGEVSEQIARLSLVKVQR